MIVSWNWLSQYVRLDMPVEALADRLALTGLNHESTAEVGGDYAIDLEVTSNRPDCLGHLGVAREISVIFGKDLKVPDPRLATSGPPVAEMTSVAVEAPDLCPRFTARVVSGASVKPSPWWMRKRLETLGVRPISNVVDATNYVMFECGQPLHAYDLDALAGRRLVVRRARTGEKLVAINNKTYELTPDMLAIADADRPVGLAGVMGGLDTEIGPATRFILIEAARFDPLATRRTGRALGLASPASYRFERPIDPERTEWASRRCAEIILETAGGTLHPGLIDIGAPVSAREPILLRLDQIPRVLGIAIDAENVAKILRALGMEPSGGDSASLSFLPPSWRADLDREIDLIEEVARIHGYEHIPENQPLPLARSARGSRERVETEARRVLTGWGFHEACTFSLVAESRLSNSGIGEAGSPLLVHHSTRKLETALRMSLVPSLLDARAANQAHGTPDARLFEIANVYLGRADAAFPEEPTYLAILAGCDFLEMKGIVEALLATLHLAGELRAVPPRGEGLAMYAAGKQAGLWVGERQLGFVGEIAPVYARAVDVKSLCAAAELDLSVLMEGASLVPQLAPLPAFPSVERDLSLVIERAVPWAQVAEVVRGASGPTLAGIVYLDAFSGADIPEAKHSLHFGMTFRDPTRTLTGEEVDRAVAAIVAACSSRLGATLRA